jgi:hypothetical protein
MDEQVVVNGEAGILKTVNIGSAKNVYIGDDVTTIGGLIPNPYHDLVYYQAFKNNDKITSIKMADSVKFIGDKAFENCSNLTTIELSKNILRIGHNAFYNCKKLTRVDIYPSLLIIGSNCFYGCHSLKTIYYHGSYHEFRNLHISFDETIKKIIFKTNDGSISLRNE